MLLYAITNRALLAETEAERFRKLLVLAEKWAANGVDFIQIREKDLSPASLARLAGEVVRAVRQHGDRTKVLLNAAPQTAAALVLESGADGIHLRGGLHPEELAATVSLLRQRLGAAAPMSVSCHSVADVQAARAAGASLALFGPVFEKTLPDTQTLPGHGLKLLTEACSAVREPAAQPQIPVLALGGVTPENASQCLTAGAAGLAAIRLFLDAESVDAGMGDWKPFLRGSDCLD